MIPKIQIQFIFINNFSILYFDPLPNWTIIKHRKVKNEQPSTLKLKEANLFMQLIFMYIDRLRF